LPLPGPSRARTVVHIRAASCGTALHRIVLEHFETFRAQVASIRDGEGLPRFVEQEFREFLGCGCLASGFARFQCDAVPSVIPVGEPMLSGNP
jgi:hypothetical protein